MTAVSTDGHALSVVCDGCGRIVRDLHTSGQWNAAWALMCQRGWSGSASPVGGHYCQDCEPPDDHSVRAGRPDVHPSTPDDRGWLSVDRIDDVVVVSVAGELDIRVDADLNYALARAVETCEVLLVGMVNVDMVDSTIIRTLVRAQQRVTDIGGTFALLSPPARVVRVLDVLGLSHLFPVYRDLDAALAAVRRR